MIVLDTHALLWWTLDPEKLSPTAARACDEIQRTGGYASAISIWEIGIKVQRQKLGLPLSIEEFARRTEKVIDLVPVDTTLWLRTLALPWSHRDPADRIIVATALSKGAPILTKDTAIHAFDGIKAIW